MDETLKRRLIGAGLLLLAAFLLASMLPEPHLRKAPAAGQEVVTIELQAPEPIATPDVAAMAVTPLPKPADPAATDPAVAEDAGTPRNPEADPPPDIESGDRSVLQVPTPELSPRPSSRPSPPPAQPVAAQTPGPTATPTSSPVRMVVAAPTTTPVPAAASPQPSGAGDRWWIQIGSYSDIANARIVETRLRAIGQTVVIAPIDTRGGVLYRVRCGPYPSQTAGQEVHARVVAAGYPEARLINP